MNTKTLLILVGVGVALYLLAKTKQGTVTIGTMTVLGTSPGGDYRELSLMEVELLNFQRTAKGLPELSLSFPWEMNASGDVRQRGDL